MSVRALVRQFQLSATANETEFSENEEVQLRKRWSKARVIIAAQLTRETVLSVSIRQIFVRGASSSGKAYDIKQSMGSARD